MRQELSMILEKLASIEARIEAGKKNPNFHTVDEACRLLGIAASTLYARVNRGEIRANKPDGKKLYFSTAELERYVLGEQPVNGPEKAKRGRPVKIKSSPKI